ncbi:uncharacterized protein LOC116253929 isoform X9 [Nymphaea colorata]|uniref:uncharacterized protein LOC116253929 isoform X9 n=1 Tax=Nymphaea colorata TaxID=210225 RepID=UPI00214F2509|nr:uncharacterized protein LOC116253929 isoform X9 [Nymphaea colorata]
MHDGVLGVSLCFKRFSDLRTKRETSHHPRRLNSSDIHIAGAASEIDASGCLVSIYGLVKQFAILYLRKTTLQLRFRLLNLPRTMSIFQAEADDSTLQ